MAPEYALWGYLTAKADVYSFGIVALEIASGKSNTTFRPENECVCLLDYVSQKEVDLAIVSAVSKLYAYQNPILVIY